MSTFNMGEFMKFNKPHQQQIQQQTMMNHQLINQGMPSVASIWEATRAMISTQEVAQDYGKQSQREANTQPPPPAQHTQHIASIWEATRAMISTQEVAQDWGKQSLREANTQPPPPAQHTQHSLSWSAQVAQQSIPGTSSGLFNTNPAHQQPQVQSVQIQQQQQQQQQHHQQQQQQQTHHQQQPRQQEYVLLSNEFNYDCEHCSFSGTSKENLQEHMRLHAERPIKHISNHKNVKSKSTFESRSDQNSHAANYAFKCDECGQGFMNEDSFNHHKKVHKIHHDSLNKPKKVFDKVIALPFVCNICKTGCATTKALSKHMKEHKDGKTPSPYTCQECGGGFASRNLLQQHMLIHKNDKKLAKKLVPPPPIRKATVKVYNNDHIRVLKPDNPKIVSPSMMHKPWKCAKCQTAFQFPAQLKEHVKKCVGKHG